MIVLWFKFLFDLKKNVNLFFYYNFKYIWTLFTNIFMVMEFYMGYNEITYYNIHYYDLSVNQTSEVIVFAYSPW